MRPGVEMPEIGRTWNHTPNVNTSNMPTQNVGMLHSTSEQNTWSSPSWTRAGMPRPTPRKTPMAR